MLTNELFLGKSLHNVCKHINFATYKFTTRQNYNKLLKYTTMTQQEFTSRTLVEVTTEEFWAINEVYNHSDLNKDEFCKMWQKMNASRVAEAKAQRKAQAEQERIRNYKWLLIEKLSKITRRNMEIAVRASIHLSKTAIDFLEKEGIKWDYNQWGGYITTSDIVYDLKKSMGLV